MNAGLVRAEGENTVTLTLDVRNPVSHTRALRWTRPLDAACREKYGLALEVHGRPGRRVHGQGRRGDTARFVDVYRSVTGDMSEPTVIGGGTYARAMPGIVAYGPMRPGRECTEHQRDEYVLVEDLLGCEGDIPPAP